MEALQLQSEERRRRRRSRLAKLKISEVPATRAELEFPEGMVLLDSQVGGHKHGEKKDVIGVLRDKNGRILKPVHKPIQGEKEIAFYEKLQTSKDPLLLELRRYTPKYYGTTELQISNRRVKFLKLEDVTEGMSEPCVIDIKIGKRTWDPHASAEKKAAEEKKYAELKQAYGFCIPGFQVYHLSTGCVRKYGKEFGKKLDRKTVVEALEIFLNASPGQPPCRDLVVQLLSALWKILVFFRSQTKLRFYSSSILAAYDAKRLRHSIRIKSISNENRISPGNFAKNFDCHPKSSNNFRHLMPLCSSPSDSGFSGQLTKHGPVFGRPVKSLTPMSTLSPVLVRKNQRNAVARSQSLRRSVSVTRSASTASAPPPRLEREVSLDRSGSYGRGLNQITVSKLCRTHSFANNFDKDIVKMKEDYATLLDELSTTAEEKQNWVRVNMIDFAHVFPADDDGVDTNYLEGIENLIKLLEKFLTPE